VRQATRCRRGRRQGPCPPQCCSPRAPCTRDGSPCLLARSEPSPKRDVLGPEPDGLRDLLPSPIPPEASTGKGLTASTVVGTISQIGAVLLTWPPASLPCAKTASTSA
jgi:hypothetical protein